MSELQDRFKERISELRNLAVHIITLGDNEFMNQFKDEDSKLSEHLKSTFGFKIIPTNLAGYKKKELISHIREKIASLELERLRLIGITLSKEYLLAAEKYVEEGISRGRREKDIEQEFLRKGWKKEIVNIILDHDRESQNISMPDKTGPIERNSFRVAPTIYRFNNSREGLEVWKGLLKLYRRVRPKELIRKDGEIRLEKNSSYYYAEKDLKKARDDEYSIRTLTAAIRGMLNTGIHMYFHSPNKPLLVEINEIMYLILPYMVSYTCALCGSTMPVNKMIKMDLWDKTRTQKIRSFVCKEHDVSVWDFLEENKIVQQ